MLSLSVFNFFFSCSFPSGNPRDSPGDQLTSPVPGSGTREASSAVSLLGIYHCCTVYCDAQSG